jgi:hypothetical protein
MDRKVKSQSAKTIGEMTEDELIEEMNKLMPKIDLCKLGDLMRHNAMNEIEEMINPIHLRPENHLALALQIDDGVIKPDEYITLLPPTWPEMHLVIEWLVDGGGIEAIEKWRLFNKHKEYEKEKYPNAYEMKQSLIYWLDDVYQMLEQEGLPNPKDKTAEVQKAIGQQMQDARPPVPEPVAGKPETFLNSLPERLKMKINSFSFDYPQFIKDLPFLIKYKFIILNNETPEWNKDRAALYDYIKSIAEEGKNTKWALLEKLFNQTNLRAAKGVYSDKKSNDFEEWEKIKKDIPLCM